MSVISLGTLEGAVQAVSENLSSSWTATTTAIGEAANNLNGGFTNSAATYEAIGRQLAQEASRQSEVLRAFGEGLGSPAERQLFNEVAAGISQNIDSMRAAGADAYASYGQAAAQASAQATRAAFASAGGAAADATNMALGLAEAMQSGDWKKLGEAAAGSGFAAAAGAVAGTAGAFLAGAFGLTATPAALMIFGLAGFAGFAADKWGGPLVYEGWKNIADLVSSLFTGTKNFTVPRDPLVLDLDGDKIEATAIDPSRAVLFDHNADGTKTATGWIKADDGIVVLDRNGNGTIDSGRELFGDNTILEHGERAGELAANGFEALADLDFNADHQIDAQDAAFAQLRIWQDLNQDGLSQANELKTLADLGISSISVTAEETNTNLGNGNTQPWTASFVRTNGTTGESGTPELSGSLLLASNNFFRIFTDDPAITTSAAALPEMQGSGAVRDLRAAMSMGTPEALVLQDKLAEFAAAPTRDAQMALLDGLIAAWGATSTMATSLETVTMPAWYRPWTGNINQPEGYVEWAPYTAIEAFAEANPVTFARWQALEHFNGDTVMSQFVTRNSGTGHGGWGTELAPFAQQVRLLDEAFEALSESVYAGLLTQTRLKPYFDSVKLVIDDAGVHFDSTDLAVLLDAYEAARPREALIDLVELVRYALPTLNAMNFDGVGKLKGWMDDLDSSSPLRAELADLNVFWGEDSNGTAFADIYIADSMGRSFGGGAGNDGIAGGAGDDRLSGDSGADNLYGDAGDDTLAGGDGADRLYGGVGSDFIDAGRDADTLDGGLGDDMLYGNDGDDQISGRAGSDRLYGGDGDDILDGGEGNDILIAYWSSMSNGNDTYLFGRGDGQDLIQDGDTTAGNRDQIRFKAGIHPDDVHVVRNAGSLLLTITGTTDTIEVSEYFVEGPSTFLIEEISFTDAPTTVWNFDDIKPRVVVITSGSDAVIGYAADDTFNGGDGDDNLSGVGGSDTLRGEAGSDTLFGGNDADVLDGGSGDDRLHGDAGDDVLIGGTGNDGLDGGDGDDVFDGGAGNDTAVAWHSGGSNGNDTYLFGRGDGQDLIQDVDATAGNRDQIIFKAGIHPEDVQVARVGNSLRLTIAGTTDSVEVNGYFVEGTADYLVEEIRFTDSHGTGWTLQDMKRLAVQTTSGNDTIIGYATEDTISGGDGDDNISGVAGNDSLHGDAGNDTLSGGEGADRLEGGAGNDYLLGESGDDVFLGGEGDDRLEGGDGDDVFDGGAGNDTAVAWHSRGSNGNDTYLFGRGDGQDLIQDVDATAGNRDQIIFKAGIRPEDVQVSRVGNSLRLSIAGTTDSVEVNGYFVEGTSEYLIEEIRFTDAPATVWTLTTLREKLGIGITVTGTPKPDTLTGTAGPDTLDGKAGADTLSGLDGDDTYIVDNKLDTVIELTGQGTDLVQSSIDYTLPDHVENLELTGTAANDGIGNSLHNTLTGNSNANKLTGGDGDDALIGNGGTDVLAGGAGRDRLVIDVDNISKLSRLKLDGGADQDTLALDATVSNYTVNLVKFDTMVISGIEVFDITGGGDNTLLMNVRDLISMHDTGQSLIVTGNTGDKLHLAKDTGAFNGAWSAAGVQQSNGVEYNAWVNSSAPGEVLLVGQALAVSLV